MDTAYITTENALNVISNWCFQKTVESEPNEKEISDDRKELIRQQRLLEREKEEFLRTKTMEEKRLEQEKHLFEMKWKLLEEEWRKLVIERERIERRRSFYAKMEDFEAAEQRRSMGNVSVSLFFTGVENTTALKKRYKDLIKIFHPDNVAGDTGIIQKINEEYENLKSTIG